MIEIIKVLNIDCVWFMKKNMRNNVYVENFNKKKYEFFFFWLFNFN